MAGYEILLVDDGSEIFRKLAWVLKQAGYQVTVSDITASGIDFWPPDFFDLMIVRISFGDLDLLQEVQNFLKISPQVRVILLSGDYQMVFPPLAYQLAIDDYIFMPCALRELWRRIDACLVRVKLLRLQELSSTPSALINQQILHRLLSKSRDFRRFWLSGGMPRELAGNSKTRWKRF